MQETTFSDADLVMTMMTIAAIAFNFKRWHT